MSFRDISRRSGNGTPTPPKRRLSDRNAGAEYSPALGRLSQNSFRKSALQASNDGFPYKTPYGGESSDSRFNSQIASRDESSLHQLRVQQREEDYAIQVMREREEELRDINRRMHVVNQIYKDLGEVVDQQQEQIDVIENRFGMATDNTRRGLEQLEKANAKHSTQAKGNDDVENETEAQDKCQFFFVKYVQQKISSLGKMMSVCGGSASVGYSLGENDQR
ncbi:hypothetical protein HJC23_008767 [Cyclotella cryptica]|uniref:t-SNARE coiled-coil homology domain-containing protein n=1 Tax=Cyclotella cryptica TaxID=29204 RepID=A0ABD3PDQ5_9STRA|eukprot:CCRYP_015677-RA/>CCRYP_015677-RA protein AED:0.28 eAED:0.29 QI:0/-1/0/1/-1/1/1/0/220